MASADQRKVVICIDGSGQADFAFECKLNQAESFSFSELFVIYLVCNLSEQLLLVGGVQKLHIS